MHPQSLPCDADHTGAAAQLFHRQLGAARLHPADGHHVGEDLDPKLFQQAAAEPADGDPGGRLARARPLEDVAQVPPRSDSRMERSVSSSRRALSA